MDALTVSQLWRYPVKSMGGERLQRTEVALDGVPGDRLLYVVDGHGQVLVDGRPWDSPAVARDVEAATGPEARLVAARGPERFDILPLLVATDGAIAAFGHDGRRLRPNIVIGGVPGLAERTWEGRQLRIGEAVIGLATLRERCIVTTYDPDSVQQDVDVLRFIGRAFGGTLALNSWAGRPGVIALGDRAQLLDEEVELAHPQLGRFVGPVAVDS
jgi:uncharacterized protein YcbX